MRPRIVMAWGASVLAALLVGAGLGGPGTRAAFSDSVTVTQEITTGRVSIMLTNVDGVELAEPSDSHQLSDTLSSPTADLGHELRLHNDGTLTIDSLALTMAPAVRGISPEMAKLTLTVSIVAPNGTTSTETRPLAYWLAEPRAVADQLVLAAGDEVKVRIHLTGTIADSDQGDMLTLTYQLTARAA